MSLYLIGNLLGRLAISYALVWLVIWLVFSHREWRAAFRKTHRWYGLVTVVALFAVGIAASVANGRFS